MGTGEMPLLVPVTRSVSASISRRTSSKSVNFFPLQCKNSAYSAPEAGWGGEVWRGGGSPGSYLSPGLEHHPKHCLLLLPRNNESSPLWVFIPTVQMGNRGSKRGSPAHSHTASSFSGEAGPLLGAGVEGWRDQPDCWWRRARTCGSIDQLQDQWASGDNARSSGQEVPAVSLRWKEDQGLRRLPLSQRYLSCH